MQTPPYSPPASRLLNIWCQWLQLIPFPEMQCSWKTFFLILEKAYTVTYPFSKHTHPWQCFSASSPGHCLPSPEPPSVSPGNWCLVPGPLSFVHQGLHGQLCSSLEVSRVPSLLSPETGAWLCLAQGQEEEDLRSYFPTQHYVTLVKSPHSSAPHF